MARKTKRDGAPKHDGAPIRQASRPPYLQPPPMPVVRNEATKPPIKLPKRPG
jgi:hypothetical protein